MGVSRRIWGSAPSSVSPPVTHTWSASNPRLETTHVSIYPRAGGRFRHADGLCYLTALLMLSGPYFIPLMKPIEEVMKEDITSIPLQESAHHTNQINTTLLKRTLSPLGIWSTKKIKNQWSLWRSVSYHCPVTPLRRGEEKKDNKKSRKG